jgi:hypothetical protein
MPIAQRLSFFDIIHYYLGICTLGGLNNVHELENNEISDITAKYYHLLCNVIETLQLSSELS